MPGYSVLLPNLKTWDVPLTQVLPVLKQVPGVGFLGRQTLYFAIVGLAYFVATEVSLTVGLSHILLAFFSRNCSGARPQRAGT